MRKVDLSKIKIFNKFKNEVIFYFQPHKEYNKEYPYTGSLCRFRIYRNRDGDSNWYVGGIVDIVDTPLTKEKIDFILINRGRADKEKYLALVNEAFNYVSNLQENK